jgi:hypothetical protein
VRALDVNKCVGAQTAQKDIKLHTKAKELACMAGTDAVEFVKKLVHASFDASFEEGANARVSRT